MNLLVTAGNTQSPIDRVRCITNIFSGRTGAAIAHAAWHRGHTITLATSQPDTLLELGIDPNDPGERLAVIPYRTFDDLATVLQTQLRGTRFDAVCHSAAVNDYLPAGTFSLNPGTYFNARTSQWEGRGGTPEQCGAGPWLACEPPVALPHVATTAGRRRPARTWGSADLF